MVKGLERIEHPFPPLYDSGSRILILGSFPSVKSREQQFFYGHPQNRFWRVIAQIYDEQTPDFIQEKKDMLHRNHIALWDVIKSCDIEGSSDSSITNVIPNDLSEILEAADIQTIIVNGKTAEKYFNRYTKKMTGREAVCLPSTSPANAAWSVDRLIEEWSRVLLPDEK